MRISNRFGSFMTLVICAGGMVLAVMTNAQAPTPAPPKYQPSETQLRTLQDKWKDARIAQLTLQQAQGAYDNALAALRNEGEKVRVEQKWPKEVVFDIDHLQFVEQAATPTPEVKK